MRIAITGTQNNGKTTLVETFKQFWPMYETPTKSYRDLIREKELTLNENGTLESQKIIRDFLVDQALENSGKTKTLHDRCVLDNLAYSLWLAEYNKLSEDENANSEFLATSLLLTKESLKFYDIIFWLPLNPNIQLSPSPNRSTSEKYREEIDNVFHGIYEHYKKNSGVVFDKEDQPAFILLEGDVHEKINTIREYLNPEGDLIETEQSVLGDLETMYDEIALRSQIKNVV
jgi:hypothetical protein